MIKKQLRDSSGASGIEIELEFRREGRFTFQIPSAGITD